MQLMKLGSLLTVSGLGLLSIYVIIAWAGVTMNTLRHTREALTHSKAYTLNLMLLYTPFLLVVVSLLGIEVCLFTYIVSSWITLAG